MIVWGLVSMGTMFITGETSFYVARVLLGLAEAGFFPGMVLYLTYWIPKTRSRESGGAVHDGGADRDDRRRAGFGRAPRARRLAGTPGLAVAVPHRGPARRRAGHRDAVLPDRPSGAGGVARARGTRVAERRHEPRARRARAAPARIGASQSDERPRYGCSRPRTFSTRSSPTACISGCRGSCAMPRGSAVSR